VSPTATNLSKLGIKIPLPEPYDGATNMEAFENWLIKLVDWLQAYNLHLDTPEMDATRVKILSQNLKDKASTYMNRRLDEARQAHYTLTFHECVIVLRNGCLHKTTELEAVTKFENLTQGSRDVQTLLDDLDKYAARMAHPPSNYQFGWRLRVLSLRRARPYIPFGSIFLIH
jgi:hypothetical protein